MNQIVKQLLWLIKPKFYHLINSRNSITSILDIGIANHSYKETKALFLNSQYTGLDILPIEFQMDIGDKFFQLDLEKCSALTCIENEYFDLIYINHVLEHLSNGEDIFKLLCERLAPGGVLYAEFPSILTAATPKTNGSYHFHDDPTHKRFYTLETLANIALNSGLKIGSCGCAYAPLKSALSIPRSVFLFILGKPYGSALLFIQKKISYICVCRPKS